MHVTRPRSSSITQPGPFVGEVLVAGPVVVWAVGTATALVLIGLVTVRVVVAQQLLVVLRRGKVVAVKGRGVAFVLPGLHRTVRVPREPVRVDLWWVEARSRDGVLVSVSGSLLTEVHDPAGYALHPTSARAETERVATECVRGYVGVRTLAELVRPGAAALRELATAIGERTAAWGVRVTDLELPQMDVALREELIRWAHATGGARQPNGRRSTMDVRRTTVPGKGTLHHCVTRGGQHFAVLVDNSDARRLLVYGSTDLDVPAQTIVLEHDEADAVADILHSSSVADRLAALERRFAEVTGAPR